MDVKPVWRLEKWEGRDEWVVTLNGAPVGQSVDERTGNAIVEWLKTSWREMLHEAA